MNVGYDGDRERLAKCHGAQAGCEKREDSPMTDEEWIAAIREVEEKGIVEPAVFIDDFEAMVAAPPEEGDGPTRL
jgi:hypothetical protein